MVPTIVVGGLGFGGVGKTAVVAHLAAALAERARVGIVGHGYGGRTRTTSKLTSPDGQRYGDEAAALFRALGHQCDIWIGADRSATCAQAGAQAEVLVVDRGLGDPRLKRTVEVVVMDDCASTQVFPAGPLRTSPGRVSTHQWVWTHHLEPAREDENEGIGSRYRLSCVELPNGTRVGPEWLRGREVVTLCGIANPRSFYTTVKNAGARVMGGVEVGDHRPFSLRILRRFAGGPIFVTTAKDRERLPEGLSAAVLHAELEIVSGRNRLDALLNRVLDS